MTALLSVLSALLAGFAVVPLGIFALELLVGLLPARRRTRASPVRECAILIPAHDEAGSIVATLGDLKSVVPEGTHVLVVADNCSDETAALARAAKVEVAERNDPDLRGKGHALAHGRDVIAQWSHKPDVVIVLDADCRLFPGSVEALRTAASAHQAPVQAINLIEPDLSAPPLVQISGFAMVVKNLFRSRGMQRLGGAALLTGTGMAFPWPLFAAAKLATDSLVEDLTIGIELTREGHVPRLVEGAQVRSAPASMADALQQRKRWEHGFLENLRRQAIPVLMAGVRRGIIAEIFLGLHLMVPPLAFLLLFASVALAGSLALFAMGASAVPSLVLAGILATALALVAVAWLLGGRSHLSGRALALAPLYILWKIPLYLGFFTNPEREWKRTPRRKS